MNKLIILIACVTMGISSEGKIGGVTYFDFVILNDSSAFNFQRQYISYTGEVSDKINYKIVCDVGRTNDDTRLVVFLKKAQIDYKTSYGKVSMGLIGMNTYGVQEKNWGYRFIEKSAIDKYGFSSTTDIGFGISKSLRDNLNMSLQISNGEGFKKPQGDKSHKISFNATYGERKLNKNDGYNAGVVYSIGKSTIDSDKTNMISAFGGFSGMGLRLGAEYDYLTKGSGLSNNAESVILSVSANYGVIDNLDAYFRYDMWDDYGSLNKKGANYYIAGVLFNCGNSLSVAPNIRITTYEDLAKLVSKEYRVNFQFKF